MTTACSISYCPESQYQSAPTTYVCRRHTGQGVGRQNITAVWCGWRCPRRMLLLVDALRCYSRIPGMYLMSRKQVF